MVGLEVGGAAVGGVDDAGFVDIDEQGDVVVASFCGGLADGEAGAFLLALFATVVQVSFAVRFQRAPHHALNRHNIRGPALTSPLDRMVETLITQQTPAHAGRSTICLA